MRTEDLSLSQRAQEEENDSDTLKLPEDANGRTASSPDDDDDGGANQRVFFSSFCSSCQHCDSSETHQHTLITHFTRLNTLVGPLRPLMNLTGAATQRRLDIDDCRVIFLGQPVATNADVEL